MNSLNWLAIALGLAMDAFAVSITVGLAVAPVTPRHVFRLAFHFGLFQFLMPILGWLAGTQLATYVEAYDHWVAFGLLGFVGAKMLWESQNHHEGAERSDPTRGIMLVTLSVATSIDALAVGLSTAFLQVSVWFPAVVIGLVAATLTSVGISFGSKLGRRAGRWAEVLGGCLLLWIGARILLMHLGG